MGSSPFYSFILLSCLIGSMLILIGRWKVSPFIVLMLSAWLLALFSGISVEAITPLVTAGMGNMFGNVALIIIMGTLLGRILELSGGAVLLAEKLLTLSGGRCSSIALAIMGYIVSVPVYCDSGFILLNGLRQSIADRGDGHPVALNTSLAGGLYATSALVPPTPGPAAAAVVLGLSPGLVILPGMALALLVTLVAVGWGWIIARQYPDTQPYLSKTERDSSTINNQTSINVLWALLPILLPLILMSLATSFGDEVVWAKALGQPANALFLGVLAALPMTRRTGVSVQKLLIDSVESSASIILIIVAGGALAAVLSETNHISVLTSHLPGSMGLLLPFLIALTFKVAQGATTVALISSASIVEAMLPSLGLDSETGRVLVFLALGAGAMTLAHANDSYFWVVTQFGKMDVATGYKSFTLATLWQGLIGFAVVLSVARLLGY